MLRHLLYSVSLLLAAEPIRHQVGDTSKHPVVTSSADGACEVIPNYGYKSLRDGLTAFWDREGAGQDLARKHVEARKNFQVKIGVIDDPGLRPYMIPSERLNPEYSDYTSPWGDKEFFGGHASATSGIILGAPPFGTSATGLLNRYLVTGFSTEEKILSAIRNGPEQIYNRSMSLTAIDINLARALTADPQRLWVNSAGNRGGWFETEDRYQELTAVTARAYLVGAVNALGTYANFSLDNPLMNIFAPADLTQGVAVDPRHESARRPEYDPKTRLMGFGGTSGAAPHVTAVMSNALGLIPNLSAEELIFLGRDSAFNLGYLGKLRKVPMINAYRLVKVVEKINERCPYDPNDSTQSIECRKALYKEWPKVRPEIYAFEKEANGEFLEAKKLLESPDCEQQKKGFQTLRRAFFLRPTPEVGRALMKAYADQGYPINAAFIHSLFAPPEKHIVYLLSTVDMSPKEMQGLSRDIQKSGFDLPSWVATNLSASVSEDRKSRAMRAAAMLEPKDFVKVVTERILPSANDKVLNELDQAILISLDAFTRRPAVLLDLYETMLRQSMKRDYSAPQYQSLKSNNSNAELNWLLELPTNVIAYANDSMGKGKDAEEAKRLAKRAIDLLVEMALKHPLPALRGRAALYLFIQQGFGQNTELRWPAAQILISESRDAEVILEATHSSFLNIEQKKQLLEILLKRTDAPTINIERLSQHLEQLQK